MILVASSIICVYNLDRCAMFTLSYGHCECGLFFSFFF